MTVICDKHKVIIKAFPDSSYRVVCEVCSKELTIKDFRDAYPAILLPTPILVKLMKREIERKK